MAEWVREREKILFFTNVRSFEKPFPSWVDEMGKVFVKQADEKLDRCSYHLSRDGDVLILEEDMEAKHRDDV